MTDSDVQDIRDVLPDRKAEEASQALATQRMTRLAQTHGITKDDREMQEYLKA